jgi:hypothetical protein
MWRFHTVIEEMLRSARHKSRAIPQRTGTQSSDEHVRQLGFAELQARMCVCVCVCVCVPFFAPHRAPQPPRVLYPSPCGCWDASWRW